MSGIDPEQVRHLITNETQSDMRGEIESVRNTEQISEDGSRVPERMSVRSGTVLPRIAPPRRGRYDRERNLSSSFRNHTSVITRPEHVERERARIEVIDTGREIGKITADEIQIYVIERARAGRSTKRDLLPTTLDRLRDTRCEITQLRDGGEIKLLCLRLRIQFRIVGDGAQRRNLGWTDTFRQRYRRTILVDLVWSRFVLEIETEIVVADLFGRVGRSLVIALCRDLS